MSGKRGASERGTVDVDRSGVDPLEPEVIHSDSGRWLLAATEDAARAFAVEQGFVLGKDAGWMMETGWDDENFESREEFEEMGEFTSWWMGCLPPKDGKAKPGVLRAWEVTYA